MIPKAPNFKNPLESWGIQGWKQTVTTESNLITMNEITSLNGVEGTCVDLSTFDYDHKTKAGDHKTKAEGLSWALYSCW